MAPGGTCLSQKLVCSQDGIIGRSYEYLIHKFAEGSGQSAGEIRVDDLDLSALEEAAQPEEAV